MQALGMQLRCDCCSRHFEALRRAPGSLLSAPGGCALRSLLAGRSMGREVRGFPVGSPGHPQAASPPRAHSQAGSPGQPDLETQTNQRRTEDHVSTGDCLWGWWEGGAPPGGRGLGLCKDEPAHLGLPGGPTSLASPPAGSAVPSQGNANRIRVLTGTAPLPHFQEDLS